METDFEGGAAKAIYGVNHAELDAMGEREVRSVLLLGNYGGENHKTHKYVSAWLNDQEFVRVEARAEESLSISRKALSNSRLATRIAISAIILSIIMAIQKIIEWTSK